MPVTGSCSVRNGPRQEGASVAAHWVLLLQQQANVTINRHIIQKSKTNQLAKANQFSLIPKVVEKGVSAAIWEYVPV
jgi:hypothetical protein